MAIHYFARRPKHRRLWLRSSLIALMLGMIGAGVLLHAVHLAVAQGQVGAQQSTYLPFVAQTRERSPSPPPPGEQLPAFPGAMGFGSTTPGGRGGRVLYVTTLADSGPGSLRSALEASGPRLVLFRVAGTITLASDITISAPFVTVAGQSAPGEGVQIKGAMLKIRTHDVVLRYLRLRPGDEHNQSQQESRDALSLIGTSGSEVYNVVIDHCTLIWGPDIGGPSILTHAHHITIQYSIMGEGLYHSNHPEAIPPNSHSKGMNITKLDDKYGGQRPRYITMHHNLFTTSDERMPQIRGTEFVDMVNNVIYNWGNAPAMGNPISLNLINNMFIAGPMTVRKIAWYPHTSDADRVLYEHAVYEAGTVTEGFTTVRGDPQSVYAATRVSPLSLPNPPSAQEAYATVLQEVGATRPRRDAVDQRILANLLQRQGRFLNGSDLVWPSLADGPPVHDFDSDGMADAWEQQFFGSLQRTGTDDFDRDGYTDVEEFLNLTDPTRS